MFPFPAYTGTPEPRRTINLGGSSSSSTALTPDAIFDRVHAARNARQELKARSAAAIALQRWWRGERERRTVREDLGRRFLDAVQGRNEMTALRCLVLIAAGPTGEETLGVWADAALRRGAENLWRPESTLESASYEVLVRQTALLMLKAVARDPKSPKAEQFLAILRALLSPTASDAPGSPVSPKSGLKTGNSSTSAASDAARVQACGRLSHYLVRNGLYMFIGQAIRAVPASAAANAPSAHAAACLVELAVLPLASLLNSFSTSNKEVNAMDVDGASAEDPYLDTLTQLVTYILTIPLLPNRLPLVALPRLVSALPLQKLEVLAPRVDDILRPRTSQAGTTAEDKLHLLANLHLFVSPHYKLMGAQAMSTYLRLASGLLDALPGGVLTSRSASGGKGKGKGKGKAPANTPAKHVNKKQRLQAVTDTAYSSDSSDTRATRVTVVDSFEDGAHVTAPLPVLEVDAKTAARLTKLGAQPHLSALVGAAGGKRGLFPALVAYLFSLTAAFASSPPTSVFAKGTSGGDTSAGSEAEKSILNHLLATTGGGLVREVYRDLVRRGSLGKEDGRTGTIMDSSNAAQWPPLLFLADLYSQALLTMGDDEFFGVGGSVSAAGASFSSGNTVNPNNTARAVRNPLTLDELVEFSRQLGNIAFALFYREDGGVMQKQVAEGIRCTWEAARDKVTRCLVGIHARDSRKPFVPADHWLATAHLDMNSFVEAAVLEEQQLSNPDADDAESTSVSVPARSAARSYNSRHLSKRQIAAMSPRLGILNNIPFAIPFEVRVSIFRHFVMNDMMARSGSNSAYERRFNPFGSMPKARVQVRRGMVAQDGFDRLGEIDLKGPIEITFIDQFGQEEAGIDGGGVFKEFFTSLCQEVFDTDRGLWLANQKNELYPNPHAYATEQHSLNWYRFIGRILGKAMYEGILVDVAFAGFFLAKWLGRQSFLDDLSSLDPDLYNGLIFLKHFNGNVEDLSLNFTMAIDEFGVTKSVDLIPNGSNIAVTKENRLQYIYCVSHYRLSKQIKAQSAAFFEGLSEMIDQKWLRMFNQQEVQILIGGVNAPIDLDDLRKHTNYGGLYDDGHEVVQMFWDVVNDFDQEQRRALLRFVTSCSRPPLLGFKELVPNFSIRDAGSDQYRLPTSSTCVNLLKLPRYNNSATLRQKLIQAINSNAGFDLS